MSFGPPSPSPIANVPRMYPFGIRVTDDALALCPWMTGWVLYGAALLSKHQIVFAVFYHGCFTIHDTVTTS